MIFSSKKIVFSFLFFGTCLLFFAACYYIAWQGIYLAKEPKNENTKIFRIEKGQNVFTISENLEKANLIKNKAFFELYVILKGEVKDLKAGTFLFSPAMSIKDISQKIFKGENLEIKITIPEGFSIEQIEEEINEKFETESIKFRFKNQKVGLYKNEFSFLKDIPSDASLEGFLFPDTYLFKLDTTEKEIVETFLRNFDKKLTPELQEKIQEQNKTIFEIITMASLLEKEVKTFEDKKIASGTLWKRENSGMPLQVDATIIFITGKKSTKVSVEETRIDSLYNTYKYKGLPPGPICNPGLDSIIAAIEPKASNFWFYLSTPEGKTIFSKTLEEHNIAKAKYL